MTLARLWEVVWPYVAVVGIPMLWVGLCIGGSLLIDWLAGWDDL